MTLKKEITAECNRWTLWIPILGSCLVVFLSVYCGDTRGMHTHRYPMLSIGLTGSYAETTALGTQIFRAPWLRFMPGNFEHSIDVPGKCRTLCIGWTARHA